MRACLFGTMQSPRGLEQATPAHFLSMIERADRDGFDAVFLAERHFTGYGVIGNPTVFAAAVAARTSRLTIGFAALILALHNPWRLADELVMLDVLSGGRLLVGVGTGNSPVEFGALGINREERAARFAECLDILECAWKGEPFVHEGKHFPATFPGLRMRPIQPTIPLIRAVVHEDSVIDSARRRIPILNGRFYPAAIQQNLDAYTGTLTENGASDAEIRALVGRSGVLRHVVVAGSDEEAHAIAREGLRGYIERANEVIEPHDLDTWYPQVVVAGTAQSVIQQIQPLAALGLGRLLCWFDFGTIDHAVADESLDRFTRDVLPHLDGLQIDGPAASAV